MNILKQFYDNETQRETVKAFLIETLGEIAIERAFDGEDTQGIQEAKACVDKAFDKLEEEYGKIEEPIKSNSR